MYVRNLKTLLFNVIGHVVNFSEFIQLLEKLFLNSLNSYFGRGHFISA